MTLPSRHRIRNSSQDGLRPSTLPLGHGGSPQNWLITSERRRNIYFLWNLKVRVGFEPAISDSPSSSFNHCTRRTIIIPVHSCVISTRRSPAAISAISKHCHLYPIPGVHFHLSQVKHLRVKCLAQGHNVDKVSQDWEGEKMMSLKILHEAPGFETAW